MINAGLILEGGGMKGVYTAGVLDFFLEKNVEFSSCYGVSAGACAMVSYIAKQKNRAYRVLTNYLDDKRYMGVYSFLSTGDLFDVKTCYDLIPNYLDPVDYDTFYRYQGKAYAVVTNIMTGKPEYHRVDLEDREMISVRASASLPLVSRNVMIHHIPYLDGGISDSIPIRKSIADGNRKNIIVLTKDAGYVRKPAKYISLFKLRYAAYPKVAELMKNRHNAYNETMQFIEEMEKKGEVFVIRPSKELAISRTEKDAGKLQEMYCLGYQDAKEAYESMMQYLN